MKKIRCIFLLTIILQQAIAQTETFDIATYAPPKDWKKATGAGVVSWSAINTGTGGFCILSLYASYATLGTVQKDFNKEWKARAVVPNQAEANPKTETQTTPEGWKVITAASPIKVQGMDAYVILTVFSGFGKKFTVMTTLNDQSYINGIDSLLQHITLNKTGIIAAVPPQTPASPDPHNTKGQFGQVIYTAPDQWKTTKYSDGDILAPVNLPKGEFLEIWVQPSMIFSGTMEQALKKSYDETVVKLNAAPMNDVNGGRYQAVPSKISFRGWEYIRCTGGIHMGGGDYPPEYGLDLFVIKMNGRFEQVAIIRSRNNCNLSRYYPSDRLKYYNDIERFLFSLQFPDWKEPDQNSGLTDGNGIGGVWQGISMSVGVAKPGAGLGAELKVKQLIFFPNGQAYFGTNFPAEGLDELNTRMKAEVNRRDWGTYSFANGKGILKLPYAEIPLRLDKGKLIITTNQTDHGFIKSASVDGARFNGTYALSSKNFLGEETGTKPLIRFTADGKFTDNGAMKILYHEYIDCLNEALVPGAGTYEVKNYSVIFTYTDGRKIRIAFPGSGYDKSNQSPATLALSFNEDVMMKQ